MEKNSNGKERRQLYCCICGGLVSGIGHNPYPVEGEACCDYCDSAVVLPFRLQQMRRNRNANKQ